MLLGLGRTEWLTIAFVSAVVSFLSLLLIGYLWYYQSPSFENLSKREVVVTGATEVGWSKGAATTLRYVEVMAVPAGSTAVMRFILSSKDEGLYASLKQRGGRSVIWFDARQANEIFQIQVADAFPVKYEDVYAVKTKGAGPWWRGSLFLFVSGLFVFLFSTFNLKKPSP